MTKLPQGRLHLVGIGPGDPELMTCKAVRILEACPVWAVPKARNNGPSSALEIAARQVDPADKTILELCFPMQKIRLDRRVPGEVLQGWRQAARRVLEQLDQGRDVAFPTLGDPSLYSTGFYLLATLQHMERQVAVNIVPGITAMAACSANVLTPLGLGDDVVSIVPAAFDDDRLRTILTTYDAVVLMKVHRRMNRLVPLLDELGLLDRAVLVERCGLEDQQIYPDVRKALDRELHYFSTLLVRRRPLRQLRIA